MGDGYVVFGYIFTYGALAVYAISLVLRGRVISSKTDDT